MLFFIYRSCGRGGTPNLPVWSEMELSTLKEEI